MRFPKQVFFYCFLFIDFSQAEQQCRVDLGEQKPTASLLDPSEAESASTCLSLVSSNLPGSDEGLGLRVFPSTNGILIECHSHDLVATATQEGLWLNSTGSSGLPFRVVASAIGRKDNVPVKLADQGTVAMSGRSAFFFRPILVEEYSVSIGGIRQDFLVVDRPLGDAPLRLEIEISGSSVSPSIDGSGVSFKLSGREISYNRLRVYDSKKKEFPATIEWEGHPSRFSILVDDTGASYPLRIDPTFNDSNWMGLPRGYDGISKSLVMLEGNLFAGGYTPDDDHARPGSDLGKWNGQSWSLLGMGFSGTYPGLSTISAMEVIGDSLYVAGSFTTAGGVTAKNIAKWDGNSWSPLGAGVEGVVLAMVAVGNDLYVGGDFNQAGGIAAKSIAKWDGTAWSPVSSGTNSYVFSLAVIGTDVYAGGLFTTAGGIPANRIAVWNGIEWSSLGTGMNGHVNDMAVQGGNLFVGGSFSTAGGVGARNIAKWNGVSWSNLGSGVNSDVFALAADEDELFVGGDFQLAGNRPASRIARWDGVRWSPLGSGVSDTLSVDGESNEQVYSLLLDGDDLYAGGTFTVAGQVELQNFVALATTRPPRLSIKSPSRFRPTKVGLTSKRRTIVFRNFGSKTASGLSTKKEGKDRRDFIVSSLSRRVMAPGSKSSFSVAFRPKKRGIRRATILIRSNTIPRRISIRGRGL